MKIIFKIFLFLMLIVPGQVFASEVILERQAENPITRLIVDAYSIQNEKLGDPAPEGSLFLILRGTLINKVESQGVSVPPAQEAFYLRLTGEEKAFLHPLSAETVDPLWGPQVLGPSEELPFEMVFTVPARELKEATLMHLSAKGPLKIYIIGDGPTLPTKYLSGPERRGTAEIAIEKITFVDTHNGKRAPKGKKYLYVDYWFTNIREMHPLETYLAEFMAIEEDGRHVYSPIAQERTEDNPIQETYYAHEPTKNQLTFLVPEKTGDLVLVYFEEEGPLKIDLTPDIAPPVTSAPVAGPIGDRSVKLSIYADASGFLKDNEQILVLDVGLRLNNPDPSAWFLFKPAEHFEVHTSDGTVLKPVEVKTLQSALGSEVKLHRDTEARGTVAFKVPSNASNLTLVIPFVAGATKLPIPTSVLGERSESGQPIQRAQPQPKKAVEPKVSANSRQNDLNFNPLGGLSNTSGETSSTFEATPSTAPQQSADDLHPREIREMAKTAMRDAGLTSVEVRSRKKDELILLGNVGSEQEKQLAESIASQQPGIATVVNRIKVKLQ